MLTIVYITVRKEPKLEWFLRSLLAQAYEEKMPPDEISVLVVNSNYEYDGQGEETKRNKFWYLNHPTEKYESGNPKPACYYQLFKPKPSVWQGSHRLTSVDYFAASNARNTGLCYAEDGWVAFVDDLSVLLPGWLKAVRTAMTENHIVLGAYKKVKQLVVENGEVKSFEEFPGGVDSRLKNVTAKTQVDGGWMYGCSFAGPVEAFLTINGFPEFVDGMGSEDYLTGIVLENAGYKLFYDPSMMTYESEELHHVEKAMKRIDKGKSPNDKSHAALRLAKQSKSFPNYFGEGGIRELRKQILAGGRFPIMGVPEHDWFDGQPLREM